MSRSIVSIGSVTAAGLSAAVLLASAGARAAPAKPGDPPPAAQVRLKAAKLREIRGAIQAGRGGPVIVNFWASWCEPCVAELPDLARLERRYASSRLRMIGISVDLFVDDDGPGLRRKLAGVLDSARVEYSNYLYTGGQDPLVGAFDLPGAIPYSILYDSDGHIVRRWAGRLPLDQLDEAIRSAARQQEL